MISRTEAETTEAYAKALVRIKTTISTRDNQEERFDPIIEDNADTEQKNLLIMFSNLVKNLVK